MCIGASAIGAILYQSGQGISGISGVEFTQIFIIFGSVLINMVFIANAIKFRVSFGDFIFTFFIINLSIFALYHSIGAFDGANQRFINKLNALYEY